MQFTMIPPFRSSPHGRLGHHGVRHARPLGGEAAANPFDTLLGSWRGSGQIGLNDGRRERLTCNAYYTGGGSQLGMAIRCQSDTSNVEIRSKLSLSGGRISGTWEERTFNARGPPRAAPRATGSASRSAAA